MAKIKNGMIYFIIVLLFVNCKSSIKEAPIILFNGTGTSANDVEAIKSILLSNQMDFVLVNSEQLSKLDTGRLKKYKLLIIPGGNFIEIGKDLTVKTTGNIQAAVRGGLNYLGICAGGFLAGDTHSNSFNITNGVQFKFYSAAGKGIRKAAVAVTNADSTMIEHYWEDGPQFNGWGEVVSKYPDGTAATVEGNYGSGWIILTGVHAEAPESWRKAFYFSTPIENSHQYITKLIKATMEKTTLTHF
jgi:glutamine amidotransferase-like uncharacterized protein